MEKTIKTFILFAFIAIVAAGIIAFLYFVVEKPAQEQPSVFYNLNVKISSEGKQVAEPFSIIMNGQLYKSFNSSSDSYTSISLPINNSYQIFTESYDYYNVEEDFSSYGNDKDLRKDIVLQPYGNVSINVTNMLADKEVFLKINVTGIIKNPILCFRWSKNIIGVSLFNQTIAEKPKRLGNKVDKCFLIANELKDEEKSLDLTFKWFGNIEESDYIKAYLIDADIHYFGGLMAEDAQKNDIGISDIYFEIR